MKPTSSLIKRGQPQKYVQVFFWHTLKGTVLITSRKYELGVLVQGDIITVTIIVVGLPEWRWCDICTVT